jgi:hypothetical protein
MLEYVILRLREVSSRSSCSTVLAGNNTVPGYEQYYTITRGRYYHHWIQRQLYRRTAGTVPGLERWNGIILLTVRPGQSDSIYWVCIQYHTSIVCFDFSN